MSKIEKTLELNITHELMRLADSFWWHLSPLSLRRYWRPYMRIPFLPQPKPFVTGLPINLEGRAGGGYDVRLASRSYLGGRDRVVFMQFKAGEHKDFNPDTKSIFYGDSANHKPHVEFTFNNNGKRNQHKLLQDLAKAKAGLGHPVLYCFPRITTEQQVCDNAGRLLHKTSFISVGDIDNKAALNRISINVGTEHKFRADYQIYDVNEVNLLLFIFNGPDQTKDFISEIVAIRVMRAIVALKDFSTQQPTIVMSEMAIAFSQYIRYLASYFELDFRKELSRIIQSVPSGLINDLLEMIGRTEESQPEQQIEAISRNREIFYAILTSLTPYLRLTNEGSLQEIGSVPEAPSRFTFEMDSNGLRFSFEDDVEDSDFIGITYALI